MFILNILNKIALLLYYAWFVACIPNKINGISVQEVLIKKMDAILPWRPGNERSKGSFIEKEYC